MVYVILNFEAIKKRLFPQNEVNVDSSQPNSSPVQEFILKVESLHEVEYGDFKRKVGQYLNRLEQRLSDTESRNIIARIRHIVVYDSPDDISIAREEAISLAQQLLSRQTVH